MCLNEEIKALDSIAERMTGNAAPDSEHERSMTRAEYREESWDARGAFWGDISAQLNAAVLDIRVALDHLRNDLEGPGSSFNRFWAAHLSFSRMAVASLRALLWMHQRQNPDFWYVYYPNPE